MTDRPNWGHGLNEPVLMFTEAEIEEAIMASGFWAADAHKILAQLKETRHGRQEAQYSHPALGGKGDTPPT